MCLLARTSSIKPAFLFLSFPGFREEPIKSLHRILVKKGEFHNYDDISIPTYIIGFKGPSTEQGIEKIYKTFSDKLIPNGILSIGGEIFMERRLAPTVM